MPAPPSVNASVPITGGSLTSVTVIETVAGTDGVTPSVVVKVKLSVPK